MASTSTTPAESSTSSSSPSPEFYYDVFLSFRGEDVRKKFVDHLYSALVHHGFITFRDDEELKRGEEIGPELLKSIERSRISVIVFSRNYAASRWCLDELVRIMECRQTIKQIVLPVFYDVDQSHVRHQRGSFAEAFVRHEERYKDGGGMEGKLEKWRASLTEASNLSGWDVQNVANGHESKFIEMIIKDISKKLHLRYLNVADYPVGIERRAQRVNELLQLESNGVCMVGIWGIGGIGKTTIAKAIYNQIRLQFEGCGFITDVRETAKQHNGLVGLQEHLLSKFQMNENRKIRNVHQGIEFIKQRVWRRRVLVVLDDVDEFEQLKTLAIRRDWFHSGSRIIITTRDESILKFLEVDGQYEPEFLTDDESLRLFSWHAFGKDHPTEDYVELSKQVVACAEGLPLVLEVWGPLFKCTSMPVEWKNTLERLREIPSKKIQEKLRISYDSLEDEDKKLFLDIACFFVGMDTNYTREILEGCHRFPESGLGVLSRRRLIRSYGDCLKMHDMIRDLGRDIVRTEHPREPGKRSRLWFHEDVLDALKNHTGTEVVEGLSLNLPMSNDEHVNTQAFAKMNSLRLLKVNYIRLCGSCEHLSKRLRWLCWHGFPLKSIPPNLFIDKVVVLDMCYSSLKQIWKGKKVLSNLKFLNLSHSYYLIDTPDFSRVTNLEKLLLNDCIRLEEVHQSIECLNKLVVLDMSNCRNLRKLPLGICKLTSLQSLSLSGCSKLGNLFGFEGSPSKLWFLASSVRNPNSIGHSPGSILGLISITDLNLAYCNLSFIPNELGSLISLKLLNLKGNNFYTLPGSISNLSQLSKLVLSQCTRLQSLPEFPVNLRYMIARYCPSLQRISIRSDLQKFPTLTFPGCHKLVENNNIGSKIAVSLLQKQELDAVFRFQILIPGGEVPDYFNYQSVGSVLSFIVCPLANRKIQGCIICVVIAGGTNEMVDACENRNYAHLVCKVTNKTKGLKADYCFGSHDALQYRQDHVFLEYLPPIFFKIQMEEGDEVEYSFGDMSLGQDRSPRFQVNKCGVILTYENNAKDYPSGIIDPACIQHASHWYRAEVECSEIIDDHTEFNEDEMYYPSNVQAMIRDDFACMGMSCLVNMFQQIKQWFIRRSLSIANETVVLMIYEIRSLSSDIGLGTCDSLLAGLSDACIENAQKMFDEMSLKGVPLSTLGFGASIWSLCRNAEMDKILGLLEEVKRNSEFNGSIIVVIQS